MPCFMQSLCAGRSVHDWLSLIISVQEQNPFLNSTLDVDLLIRSPSVPAGREPGRLGSSVRILQPLHFPPDMVPFDEALRDVSVNQPTLHSPEMATLDRVAQHGAQFLEIKSMERKGKWDRDKGLHSLQLYPKGLLQLLGPLHKFLPMRGLPGQPKARQ